MSLERGADVNARDKYGTTLQLAERGGHRELVLLLLRNGADREAQDIIVVRIFRNLQ